MSVTFSETAAAALLELARRPGMAGRRLVLRDLHGTTPAAIFDALASQLTAAASVNTGNRTHAMQATEVMPGRLLIPYLVDDQRPGQNAGSAGFAATLRTQFLDGAQEDRVLLILDPRPVETVLTAAEDAAAAPELQWQALTHRATQTAATTANTNPRGFIERVINAFDHHREPSPEAFADLTSWLERNLPASDASRGTDLWQLGCFLSDPEASTDSRRLEDGAKLRHQLDERYASRSKPWDTEVRKLLARKRVPTEVIDRVAAAAGPFGVRYETFTLAELLRQEDAPPPLRTDQYDPIGQARAVLRDGDTIVAWLPAAAPTLHLQLHREAQTGDVGAARWSGTAETGLELVPGQHDATLPLPSGEPWLFGTLELAITPPGGTAEQTEELQLAIHRSDGPWFPVEDQLAVDASEEAFVCEQDPIVIAYSDGTQPLGRCSFDLPDSTEDHDRLELEASFQGATVPLPVLLAGDTTPDAPAPPEPPDGDPEDPPDDPAPASARSEHPSIPHALLAAGRTTWPDAATREQDDTSARQVEFRIGAQQLKVAPQRPAGFDAAVLEQAILAHPEWISYLWASTTQNLTRAPAAVLGALPPAAVEQFTAARAALFAAAAARGSIYALDPSSAEATSYVDAYAALLAAVPREGRYVADWDALLLCDCVQLAGRRDLLIAPTSPLAVAFHCGLAEQLATWTQARDIPPAEDVRALSLRHALPLLHSRNHWYETASIAELLWRRYVPLSGDAPGVPERNASFIAQRLRFFLHVHHPYLRPDQILSVAFHQPGDGQIVLDALRAFYRRERSAATYTLPRLHIWLVGASEQLASEVADLLGGGRQDDLDRLVQSRITVSTAPGGRPPDFAHVTFLFRSPGVRGPRQVPMTDRPQTAHLGGLAAAPGRKVYEERNKVFTWGTWAPEQDGQGTYRALLSRSLELVAGQPAARLTPGWTQMASTSVDQDALDELYGERSVWVVHLDRLIGIEAFGGARQLIEYEERADPDQPGYDGITATEQLTPYLDAVGRALTGLGNPTQEPLRRLLQLLNAVSGRWAIELLQRDDNDILQRIGFVAAIAAIEQLDGCLGTSEQGTGVLVALDELIAGRPHAGLPRFSLPVPRPEGKMCDDLLLLWIPHQLTDGEPVCVRGAVIEVKYASTGRPSADEARGEITRTRTWLGEAFNAHNAARPFRARDLAELISAAGARAATFQLGTPLLAERLDPVLDRIVAGDYRLELTHWRDGSRFDGIIVSVEGESTVATHHASLGQGTGGDSTDITRLGRPILSQLVAGAKLRPAGRWAPISFQPPAGDTTTAPAPPAPPGGEPAPAPSPPAPPGAPAERTPGSPSRETPAAPALDPAVSEEVAQTARALDAAMEKYRLATEPFQPDLAQVGPNVIRFRTRPLGPLSVSDIERRARDLGREVGAPGGVIVSQEPRYICIDVPRAERTPVLYRDLMGSASPAAAPGDLNFIVGVAPSGEVRVADLARLPHLLVAGATGSGKSVLLRAMLCHLVRTRGPATLKILLIDPKGLDFAGFAGLPHLEGGAIISDPAAAVQALQGTIESELERRRPILVRAGVTSATEFYERGGTYDQLPQMVVLVDEFADLAAVMDRQERRGFQELIQRYAQITRAFGIYLVLATQRPSVDVITGAIKANLTARIALSLPSHRDSMTVLDRAGAEDLLGNGDLLFYVNGRVERLQGTFADATDVAHALERWRGPPGHRDPAEPR